MTTFCAYCLQPHEGKGRCCSEWCERRVRGKLGWISRSRKLAHQAVLDTIHARHRHDPDFRRAALGQLTPEQTALKVFGVTPADTISDPGEGRP